MHDSSSASCFKWLGVRVAFAVLLGATLAGCSSTPDAPSQYERGTYRPPPRAPTFEPNHDAPHTTGQPGHLRPMPQVEPGPRPKRLLPQTPETARQPGIWASEAPNQEGWAIKIWETDNTIFWILYRSPLVPKPREHSDTLEAGEYDLEVPFNKGWPHRTKMTARRCIMDMSRAMAKTPSKRQYGPLASRQRACISAHLFEHCMDLGLEEFLALKDRQIKDKAAIADALNTLVDAAQAHKRERCRGVRLTASAKRVLADATEAFENLPEFTP